MKDGYPQEETPTEERKQERAPLDEVDYKRLARLTEQIPAAHVTMHGNWPVPSPGVRRRPVLPLILIGVALAGLTLLGLVYWITSATKSTPMSGGSAPNPVSQQPPPTGNATVKHEMVAIPGGTFQMGRAGSLTQEDPPHPMTISSFYMDNTEVTNAEYADFVRDTGHNPPPHFVSGKPLAGQEQWPVVNVSVEDAEAFAAWRSKRDGVSYRLPKEEEWEYAARNGDENSTYPWGSNPEMTRAATRNITPATLFPVGSFPGGKNKWGVADLIGNVWEWTASKASYYPGGKGQLNPEHKDWQIIRGGSILSDLEGSKPISSAYRDWIPPKTTNPYQGFRLERSGSKYDEPSGRHAYQSLQNPLSLRRGRDGRGLSGRGHQA